MKKFIALAALLTAATTTAAQEYSFSNADGSALSELCLAALDSSAALHDKAAELGMDDPEEETLACNGLPVARFVRKYGDAARGNEQARRYILRRGDASMETELCLAALTSPSRFRELTALHFGDEERPEEELRCNRQSLDRFVRRYAGRNLSASR